MINTYINSIPIVNFFILKYNIRFIQFQFCLLIIYIKNNIKISLFISFINRYFWSSYNSFIALFLWVCFKYRSDCSILFLFLLTCFSSSLVWIIWESWTINPDSGWSISPWFWTNWSFCNSFKSSSCWIKSISNSNALDGNYNSSNYKCEFHFFLL